MTNTETKSLPPRPRTDRYNKLLRELLALYDHPFLRGIENTEDVAAILETLRGKVRADYERGRWRLFAIMNPELVISITQVAALQDIHAESRLEQLLELKSEEVMHTLKGRVELILAALETARTEREFREARPFELQERARLRAHVED